MSGSGKIGTVTSCSQVLGFKAADEIEPFEIENLK